MRLIKFRAWFKPEQRMHNVNTISFNEGWIDTNKYNGDIEDFEIMQFTGLYDKNGVEVYEGDIVTAMSQGFKGTFEIKWRQGGVPCYILFPAWQNREFWNLHATHYEIGKKFIGVDGGIIISDKEGYIDSGLEVIGNIYENKELLINI